MRSLHSTRAAMKDKTTSLPPLFRQTMMDGPVFSGSPPPMQPLDGAAPPPSPGSDDDEPHHRYRTIWLSDIHLGTSGA